MLNFSQMTEVEQLRAIIKSLLSPSFGAQFDSVENVEMINMVYELKIKQENGKIVLHLEEEIVG